MPGLFDEIEDDAMEVLERMALTLLEVLEALERIEDRLPQPEPEDD
jgi:hypothetical protein